ncbi:coordinator of PRMT5 and differentiation stimulator isoform X1 [Hirundo rustica]|uniref:coordinator of PRMT5 and differentiation stimulator isoform X1 n=1 Tax=Hirundo rustica TaxID=43150 RepID=UPI001A9519DD|nr:coordinator of PRMT5 and differentiation stimulator isoform X1 [Hirundo rustica]XP_058278916.1 coordinator of PRMT5 and differentiation stimulator isoform X1 [Hirundo rustica]
MAAASEAANSEGKQLPNKTETVIWKPRKECLLQNIPNVPDGTSEESVSASTSPNEGDVSGSTDEGWYNIYADLDVWDSEVSNIPESSVQQDVSEHEVEDWDKELEESTYGPYGTLLCLLQSQSCLRPAEVFCVLENILNLKLRAWLTYFFDSFSLFLFSVLYFSSLSDFSPLLQS